MLTIVFVQKKLRSLLYKEFVVFAMPVLLEVSIWPSVPDEARAQDKRTLDLGSGELPVERALGVQWAIRIVLKDQPITRRRILCTIYPFHWSESQYCRIHVAQSKAWIKRSVRSTVYVGRIGKASCLPLNVFQLIYVSGLQTLVQSSPDKCNTSLMLALRVTDK